MHVQLAWGRQSAAFDIPDEDLVATHRGTPAAPVADVPSAVRQAVEEPLHFPALRRALTPDDHVAIVVDENLPGLVGVLVPLLEHIRSAGVAAAAITLVCAAPSTGQPWALDLPDEFQDIQVEVHQPGERRKLSYLATTRQGRRIYLNRSIVDADQLILLSGRRFDPRFGISGAEAALFPSLSDQATLQEFAGKLSLDAPGANPWAARADAAEVAWLLGAPFLVQIIEGSDGDVLHVLAGTLESSGEGQRLLEASWRLEVDRPAGVVIAGMGGAVERQAFTDLATAFYNAARVVKPGGKIVLLTDAKPELGRAAAIFRQNEEPRAALKVLGQEMPADLVGGFLWASAAEKAKLYLLGRLPDEVVEEMFAVPLQHPEQAARLLTSGTPCVILPDAHKTLAVLRSSA